MDDHYTVIYRCMNCKRTPAVQFLYGEKAVEDFECPVCGAKEMKKISLSETKSLSGVYRYVKGELQKR